MLQRAHYPLFVLIFIGDAITLWAYRRDANTAVLRRLVPSVLAGVGLACAWVGRRLAARIPLRVFEPLVIATTIVATVPLLTS